jgi:hypothetical protein
MHADGRSVNLSTWLDRPFTEISQRVRIDQLDKHVINARRLRFRD